MWAPHICKAEIYSTKAKHILLNHIYTHWNGMAGFPNHNPHKCVNTFAVYAYKKQLILLTSRLQGFNRIIVKSLQTLIQQ